MEVGLVPGHIVLDRDRPAPRKGHSSPLLFRPCLFWPYCNIQLSSRIVKFFVFLNYCTCLLCYFATCLVNKDAYIIIVRNYTVV